MPPMLRIGIWRQAHLDDGRIAVELDYANTGIAQIVKRIVSPYSVIVKETENTTPHSSLPSDWDGF